LDDYFTEKQLALTLGRDVRSIRRWHALRTGPPRIRVGKVILYRKSSVALWLEQHESRPPRERKVSKKAR
jgi:hypothetical protein